MTLDRVVSRINAIARTPVVIDIGPAVAALTRLLGLIEAVRARLQGLSVGGGAPGLPGPTGFPGGLPVGVRAFASGGPVTGPSGVDRVPAFLTAGEFVLRRPAAEQLGLTFLNALNAAGPAAVPAGREGAETAGSGGVTNIGDVNVTVRQPVELSALLREIRADGGRLRVRAG
ncbi:MAG: hypothetical protein AAF532_02795 [Planctomycetota bacterium]